jgi:ATP-binding cassette subfamily F protein 3
MENASVGYEPGVSVLSKLDLRIDDDDRIGLLGANGNGKSTLAKLIAGRMQPMDGRMRRLHRLSVAYFAQHQLDELNPAASAYDHVRDLLPDATEAQARARTGAMGFTRSKMDTPAKDLSGGEKARLLLGIATFTGPNLMILDEPTNHLDIDSREALVQALAEYKGAVILISHDRHLTEASVDRLWLVADGTVSNFDGDMTDYRNQVLDGRSGRNAGRATRAVVKGGNGGNAGANAGQEKRRESAKRREDSAPLRKRVKDAETAIAKLQKDLAEIDRKLADPKLYQRPVDAAFLAKERADMVRAIATAEEKWLAASAAVEAAE